MLIERILLILHIELPPPSKRRRGLAGSIVSTAVNAALIGSAVGLTVYRLWRGRGKVPLVIEAADPASPDSESTQPLPPPPPYQECEWTPVSYPSPPAESSSLLSSPPLPLTTPRKKVARHSHNTRRPRKARVSRPQTASSPGRPGSSAHRPPESDIGRDGEEGGDDQMDWIQDKLAQLIEEGKRALSREVVVMSDAKEDELDDGSGAWEEEDYPSMSASVGRTGSLRRGTKRSRARFYGAGDGSNHSLPPVTSFTPRRTHTKAFSTGSVTRDIRREDEDAWESPELRETMQRARERMVLARGAS